MRQDSGRFLFGLTIALTVLFELLTIGARVFYGQSAAEWTQATNPPLVLRVHHLFWSIPFVIAALTLSKLTRTSLVLWSIAFALILSDLIHHFIVLPIWVGNTGWHWP